MRGVPDSRHGLDGADQSFDIHPRRRLSGNYMHVLALAYLTQQIYKLRASASAAGASVSARPIWPPLWDCLNIIWSLQRAYARVRFLAFCLAAPLVLCFVWFVGVCEVRVKLWCPGCPCIVQP